jgi:hypothetical protein
VKLGCDKPRQVRVRVRVVSVEKEGLGNTQAQVLWCNACSAAAALVGCAQLGGWTVFGGWFAVRQKDVGLVKTRRGDDNSSSGVLQASCGRAERMYEDPCQRRLSLAGTAATKNTTSIHRAALFPAGIRDRYPVNWAGLATWARYSRGIIGDRSLASRLTK